MKQIEFFIDTHNIEAFNYITGLIQECNSKNDQSVQLVKLHEDGPGAHYFYLKGTWDAYETFLTPQRTYRIDLDLPENRKYCYSLTHYEE